MPKTVKLTKEQRKQVGLSDQEYKDLLKTFIYFDKDKSGFIENNELETALRMMGENPTPQDVEEMIRKADTVCKDGKVELLEFCYLMRKAATNPLNRQEELEQLFKIIDKDQTGFINKKELMIALTHDGINLTDEEIQATFKHADKDKDGLISLTEFRDLMTQSLEDLKALKQ